MIVKIKNVNFAAVWEEILLKLVYNSKVIRQVSYKLLSSPQRKSERGKHQNNKLLIKNC